MNGCKCRLYTIKRLRLIISLLMVTVMIGTTFSFAAVSNKAPIGKITILNTIANSAKKTNDVIWDKSKVKGATNYEINWRARGASTWASRIVANTNRGTTSGLTIGGCYEIRVRARAGAIGDKHPAFGPWSDTVYRYFHTTQKIRLSSNNRGSFTISWAKNPAATGYQIMFTQNSNGAGAAKNINTVGANATSFTKSGLNPGSTYYVQIRELKKIGNQTYIGNISCPVAVKIKSTRNTTASAAIVQPSGNRTVYWTPNGSVYHIRRGCSTLSRSKIVYSGTIAESGKSRVCKVCGH